MKNLCSFLLLSLISIYAFSQNHVLSLDGIDDYVDFPQPIISRGQFTIEAWVYLAGAGGGIEDQSPIFEQRTDNTGCNNSAVSMFAESHSYERVFRFGLRGDNECTGLVQHNAPAYGEWHHLAVVQDDAYSTLYMDGNLRSSVYYEHSGNYDTNIAHVSIGQATHDGANFGNTNGMMDEIRIWSTPRTVEELQENMYQSVDANDENLLAYWNFEDSNTQVLDQTDNSHVGTLRHGAQVIQAEYYVPPVLWGDLNEDGQVNVSDVVLLISHILNTE